MMHCDEKAIENVFCDHKPELKGSNGCTLLGVPVYQEVQKHRQILAKVDDLTTHHLYAVPTTAMSRHGYKRKVSEN